MDHFTTLFSRKSPKSTSAAILPTKFEGKPKINGNGGPITFTDLPYELVESILIYAWHADPHGLPAGGTFRFYNPHTEDNDHSPNPHNKLSTAIAGQKVDQYTEAGKRTYCRLALVSRMWYQIMQDVVKMYVAIPSLGALMTYARFVGAPLYTSSIARIRISIEGDSSSDENDGQNSSSSHRFAEWVAGKLDRARRTRLESVSRDANGSAKVDSKTIDDSRRLCRTIHVNIPSGNLTTVPAWADITTLLAPTTLPAPSSGHGAEEQELQKEITFDALTRLIITAAEPHPGLFAFLSNGLPKTLTTLDIHVSSPYIYVRPVVSLPSGIAKLSATAEQRRGVEHIQHLLVDVLQIELLEVILEMFGSFPLLLKAETDYGRYPSDVEELLAAITGDEKKDVMKVPRHEGIYTSPSLKTLALYGPHTLTHAAISDTVSHIPTIHTLSLYRHAVSDPFEVSSSCYRLSRWDAPKALDNEAFFPGLERVVVQMRPLDVTSAEEEEELSLITDVCEKRKVGVIVERSFMFI
ncbi:SubName: Full=Uncharacterized protein {ECO:0000313/EMBL:CCA75054.1} [Serendipita indica DSM 11827]|uniref:Uncharacterized protein n=1 Tax=Serendipita indica (strain DSM 11827) TaxID=1109443 RepID=G4TUR1_SERID|nr:SubName: Full=Uncharacterized protein {ECO:0000313/EMBL:CCA75054.1} [Serendipita indica DSM 11827]CCA75054.1 hypothetical protein PIIN_09039 [Serendipita indica DSM 11827]